MSFEASKVELIKQAKYALDESEKIKQAANVAKMLKRAFLFIVVICFLLIL